jgi:hypothetical protein
MPSFLTALDERTRAYLYRIALSVIALLVVLGRLASDEVQVWTDLLAALLGIPTSALAVANTSTEQQ